MLAVGEEIAIRMWNVAGCPQVNLLPRQSFFSFFVFVVRFGPQFSKCRHPPIPVGLGLIMIRGGLPAVLRGFSSVSRFLFFFGLGRQTVW